MKLHAGAAGADPQSTLVIQRRAAIVQSGREAAGAR
jgi:hypothetical protein